MRYILYWYRFGKAMVWMIYVVMLNNTSLHYLAGDFEYDMLWDENIWYAYLSEFGYVMPILSRWNNVFDTILSHTKDDVHNIYIWEEIANLISFYTQKLMEEIMFGYVVPL